jgi:hypothetical protein
MIKNLLYFAVLSVLTICEAILPATAQFRWPSELSAPTTETQTGPGISKDKHVLAPSGPSVVGKWKGELTQVGRQTPYKVELVISAIGGETKYPDLGCTGKLIRAGASKSYAFYIEVIIKGAANKGGHCPDGTVTLARAGDNLALLWFGSIDANMIIAYGALSR